jgi:hypothetical protein
LYIMESCSPEQLRYFIVCWRFLIASQQYFVDQVTHPFR